MKWPLLIAGVLGLTLLQTSVVPAFQLLGVGSNLLLVVMCCWVVVRGAEEGMALVPLAGLMLGLLSFQGLATSVAALLPIIVLAALRPHLGVRTTFGWALAVVVAATLAHFIIIALVLALGGNNINWLSAVLDVLLPSVLVNLIIAIPVYWLIWLPSPRPRGLVVS